MVKRMAPEGTESLMSIPGDTTDESHYAGLPVRQVSYRNGKLDTRYEMTEIRRQDLGPSLFEMPDGFTRQSRPMP